MGDKLRVASFPERGCGFAKRDVRRSWIAGAQDGESEVEQSTGLMVPLAQTPVQSDRRRLVLYGIGVTARQLESCPQVGQRHCLRVRITGSTAPFDRRFQRVDCSVRLPGLDENQSEMVLCLGDHVLVAQ